MKKYIIILILSIIFDISTTLACVVKYNDPYLSREANFMLKGSHWSWLIVHGVVHFVIIFPLFFLCWKNRNCLMPNIQPMTFWCWLNTCLYGQYVQPFKFKLPKLKNTWVFLLLIILFLFIRSFSEASFAQEGGFDIFYLVLGISYHLFVTKKINIEKKIPL